MRIKVEWRAAESLILHSNEANKAKKNVICSPPRLHAFWWKLFGQLLRFLLDFSTFTKFSKKNVNINKLSIFLKNVSFYHVAFSFVNSLCKRASANRLSLNWKWTSADTQNTADKLFFPSFFRLMLPMGSIERQSAPFIFHTLNVPFIPKTCWCLILLDTTALTRFYCIRIDWVIPFTLSVTSK